MASSGECINTASCENEECDHLAKLAEEKYSSYQKKSTEKGSSSESEDDPLSPDESLLYYARNGYVKKVKDLIMKKENGDLKLNVNCKGNQKANNGWSPIHLASYFGHADVLKLLLNVPELDVNIMNDMGDTALHRAAFTGRTEIVTMLVESNADVNLLNSEGFKAKDLARTNEIHNLIEAAETHEHKKSESQFLKASAEGDTEVLHNMLKRSSKLNVNATDRFGNTALHLAANRGKAEAAILLLQNGISTNVKNARGQMAVDLARGSQMKQLLDVSPVKEKSKMVSRFEGALLKKTRIFGWKPFWVVLDRGVLSLHKSRLEASTSSYQKNSRHLERAVVKFKEDSGHIFLVRFSNNAVYYFAVDPNDNPHVTRQKWENAIKEHAEYSTKLHAGTEYSDDEMEDLVPLGTMQEAFQNATAHQQVLEKQVAQLTGVINSMTDDKLSGAKQVQLLSIRQQMGFVVETSKEMSVSLEHCLSVFVQQEKIRGLQLQQEKERSRVLQEALHVLAAEHHQLEKSVRHQSASDTADEEEDTGGGNRHRTSTIMSDSEDEFFECTEEEVASSYKQAQMLDSMGSNGVQRKLRSNGSVHFDSCQERSRWGGRCRLPVPMFSRNDISVWSILKQCIGKELSKITMPVVFNEPLSFLQRVVEYMEYSELIRKAAECDDPIERMEYIAAFAVSSSASNWDRVGKPFNPLLGETYELDREDLGFRIVCEQVSHHPPVSAFHAESPEYTFQGAIHPKLKFWGKSVEVTPKGLVTLHLIKHDESYSWQMVNCCVHNIIVGTLWIEHYGTMEVVNNKTKHKAVMNFKPSGWFGKDLHKVEGYIYDDRKKKLKALFGKWVEAMYSYDVPVWETYVKTASKSENSKSQSSLAPPPGADDPNVPDAVPMRGSSCNLQLQGQKLLWTAQPRPQDSSKYYSFTLFAMMLNELRPDVDVNLSPTDCRLRPDIRKLEEGDLDAAAAEKHRLEEKQRAVRKDRKKSKEEWMPLYFKQDINPNTGKEDWIYNGKYWRKDWSNCPDIF